MSGGDPKEIERKFLVNTLPDLSDAISEPIRQGYVTEAADTVETRLRQKGSNHYLTIKSGSGKVRTEYEVSITKDQFDALWPATSGRRIEKTRTTGRLPDGTVFELDQFSGSLAPLMLVEVEFGSVEDADRFTAPDWFGADVTDDKRFGNKHLSTSETPPET